MSKFLVVDDDKMIREVLSATLTMYFPGAGVFMCESGKEGLELARKEQPDVILLDLVMPGVDGYEICRELKRDDATSFIPIIMMSGARLDPESRIKGLEIGVDAFLHKPFDATELKAQIDVMLRIKRTEDALRRDKDLLENMVEERTRELKESERRFYNLASVSPVGIVRTDPEGNFTYVNPRWCEITGLVYDQVMQEGWESIFRNGGEKQIMAEISAAVQSDGIFQDEYRIARTGAIGAWILIQAKAETNDAGNLLGYIGTISDITVSKLAEEKIKLSLREKEVLLREIHHRVKNNLQVVISLLDLQSKHVKTPGVLNIFRDIKNRVRSMSLVHEQLYQSQNLARIDVRQYVQSVVDYMASVYEYRLDEIALVVATDDFSISIDTATPCGLIICELISNSMKYAFAPDLTGTILVEFRSCDDGQLILKVSDDGKGFPGDMDFRTLKSMGLTLVRMLTRQLRGTLQLDAGAGTTFTMTFSDIKPK